ncbi:MAG: OmpA family protein [Bacteroidia bacterium]
MKRILLATIFISFFNAAFGQTATYQRDTNVAKNCFDEYYEAFITRGALPVPDGEHNVVFSLRTDTSCTCAEGKLTVKDGKIIPMALIKKVDGTYEPAKRSLHPKTGQGDNSLGNVFTIIKGMSFTFLTDDYANVNAFFIEYLKPPVKENVTAPNPNDIINKPVEVSEKEKEIIKKAYEALQFENGKAVIKSSSFPYLNLVAEMLVEKPGYKISLTGYTDNVGKPESNLKLSKNRAEATKNYLVKKGVSADRIISDGLGDTNPIADNKTAEGRAKNRRVDFVVIQ